MFNAAPWLAGDVFDAVMNYRWAREVGHFFKDREKKTTASEFDNRLRLVRDDYRSDVNYVLMNLMDSHDTDRLSSQIVNVDSDYDKRVSARDNPDYDVRKPDDAEIRTQKLIILFQMTSLGSPMIFYGDEAGMWGGDDPDERKPMLWADMEYANERHHPFGKSRPDDENVFDPDLFAHYRTMIHMRRDNRPLSLGTLRTILTDDERDIYGYVRSLGRDHVLVIINNGTEEAAVTLPLEETLSSLSWTRVFSFHEDESMESGIVALKPRSGIVLKATGK
jgi:glycosidase